MVTAALPQNEWVHVALTLVGNTAMLYVNGVSQVAGHLFKNPSDLYDVPEDYRNPNWDSAISSEEANGAIGHSMALAP